MSVTRTQAIAYTREMMDAVNSARWDDTWISTVLGIVSGREWVGILNANPYYRVATRSVTPDADGSFLYTALNSGSGDTAQTWNRILSITDGQLVLRQMTFQNDPLAASQSSGLTNAWYDAGQSVQTIPVGTSTLSVTVNWVPPRVSALSDGSITIDFPDGSESILFLEAAAFLLSKGAAENDAAQTMRAMADQERQTMYAQIARRAAAPLSMGFPDRASDWGGA